MNRIVRRLGRMLTCSGPLCACDGGTDGSGASTSGSEEAGDSTGIDIDLATFLASRDAAECDVLARCEVPYAGDAPLDDCLANSAGFYDDWIIASVGAGRMTFDPRAASQCLAGYASIACTDLAVGSRSTIFFEPEQIPGCAEVLSGTVAVGGDCYFMGDCAAGTFCNTGGFACVEQPAVCEAHAGLGEPCADRPCTEPYAATGMYCDYAAETPVCVAYVEAGGACSTDDACALGLICIDGTCGTLPASVGEGESCVEDFQCADPLACLPDAGGVLTCRSRYASGGPCPAQFEGDSICDNPTAEACLDLGDGARCQPPSPVGGPCNDNDHWDCGPPDLAYCDVQQDPPTCASYGALGDPCVLPDDDACQAGYACPLCLEEFYCVDGTCAPRKDVGAACTSDWECPAWCMDGVCASFDSCQIPGA